MANMEGVIWLKIQEKEGMTSANLGEEITSVQMIATEPIQAENENTPELPTTTKASPSGVSISPTSAAVMQSLFYKEMVVKRDVVEDASSLDSEESVKDCCSCGHTSDTESGVDSLVATPVNQRLFKSFDLSDLAKGEKVEDKEETDMTKEQVITNHLEELVAKAAEDQVKI